MDVLVSGGERPPWQPLARAQRWRPPGWAVVALAGSVLATAGGGVAAVDVVHRAAEQKADRLALAVDARSTVVVRTRGRDGVLVLDVRNDGARPVTVTGVELDVPGVRARGPVPEQTAPPATSMTLALPFAVRDCRRVAGEGAVRVRARPQGRAEQVLELAVGEQGVVPADLLTAGCRPVTADRVVAVGLRGRGGVAEPVGDGVRGSVLVELRNEGAPLDLVRVHAEVPGVVFSPATVGGLGPGERWVSRLPFDVPRCDLLRRTGRVVVTVRQAGEPPRELGFRATEDEEARTVRDVDLDVVLRACARGGRR